MVDCEGIMMYDPRHTIKAVAAEAIAQGQSIYISTDGLAYLVDNVKSDVCHGWAVTDVAAGRMGTYALYCRMKVDTTQTIGAIVNTGNDAGGSAPSTTQAGGVNVGFAITADTVVVAVTFPPPAAG